MIENWDSQAFPDEDNYGLTKAEYASIRLHCAILQGLLASGKSLEEVRAILESDGSDIMEISTSAATDILG